MGHRVRHSKLGRVKIQSTSCISGCFRGWGVPIGELFDLETLVIECQYLKKWSFFFSSMPLKIPGEVASPPNGVAIFVECERPVRWVNWPSNVEETTRSKFETHKSAFGIRSLAKTYQP
jgi:hypothetical protein